MDNITTPDNSRLYLVRNCIAVCLEIFILNIIRLLFQTYPQELNKTAQLPGMRLSSYSGTYKPYHHQALSPPALVAR